MSAFLDDDGEAYDSSGAFSLAGTLGMVGSAFTPVTGRPENRNPDLTGEDDERVFLEAVATVFGDSAISGSYEKSDGADPNAAPGTATNEGDYFLWKTSDYAGVAKILTGIGLSIAVMPKAVSLPPPEDLPEEVLRTEIITEGRSPEDGTVLTAAEYADLQAELAEGEFPPTINQEVEHTIFLLRLLKLFRTLNPL